jgi:tRNA (guanine-N7-)-methyltransferase
MTQESLIIATTSVADALSSQRLFDRTIPLEIDVGCGKGRFLLAKATANPDTGFLGIDRQASRLLKIEKRAARAGLRNIRLLRLEISYVLDNLLPDQSVAAFYIFFPDPWPKRRHHGRRLFSQPFLTSLFRTLLPSGAVHVATDHMDYFSGIERLFSADPRFERAPSLALTEEERTDFERIFLSMGKPIGRCSFRKLQIRA